MKCSLHLRAWNPHIPDPFYHFCGRSRDWDINSCGVREDLEKLTEDTPCSHLQIPSSLTGISQPPAKLQEELGSFPEWADDVGSMRGSPAESFLLWSLAAINTWRRRRWKETSWLSGDAWTTSCWNWSSQTSSCWRQSACLSSNSDSEASISFPLIPNKAVDGPVFRRDELSNFSLSSNTKTRGLEQLSSPSGSGPQTVNTGKSSGHVTHRVVQSTFKRADQAVNHS